MTKALPPEMKEKYEKAKELIENSEDIKIYSHTDCDGISSGAILSSILDRLGKRYEIEIVNLDVLENVPIEHELTIFSDLGSGQPVDKFANEDSKILILDHHPPLREIDYCDTVPYTYLEINPMFYNIDGSGEICGGGLCYLLAKEFGFRDLSWIGILAAIGDIQNGKTGRLEGLNRTILSDAKEEGLVNVIENDLSLYGRQTRPLFVALSYFSDVELPITNNQNEALGLLKKLNINTRNPENDMSIRACDLSEHDKNSLIKELVMMISRQIPPRYTLHTPKLVMGESYEFINEEKYTFLRDASEFSTAMNACVRNDRPEVALKLLDLTIKRNKVLSTDNFEELIDFESDRAIVLVELEEIAKTHRAYLAQNIEEIGESNSIIDMDNLGRRLKKIREKTRFTQEEIAGMLGVRRLVITNIENGTRKITADELYFFSKIYGLSMEELYTGEDKEKRIAKFSRTFDELSNKSQKEVLEFIEFKRKLEEK